MAGLGDLAMGPGSSISGGHSSTGALTGGGSLDASGWNVNFGDGGITSSTGGGNTLLYIGLGVAVLVALVVLKKAG